MKIFKRLKSPVPKIIKKVQKACAAIGSLAVVITGLTAQYPELHVPSWAWKTILASLIINHLILQATTHEDFKDGEAKQ